MTDPWKPDICVYHEPCDDGFTAAWLVRLRWPDVTCLPCDHNQPLPFRVSQVRGRNVLFVDFSAKPDVLVDLTNRGARSIVVLDHHKSAEKNLKPWAVQVPSAKCFTSAQVDDLLGAVAGLHRPPILGYFDLEKSGAMLASEFCWPDQDPLAIVKFVDDRDLWRFTYPETRPVSMLLRSLPHTFDAWDIVSGRIEANLGEVLFEGRAIQRYYDKLVDEMIAGAELKDFDEHQGVPVAYASHVFASEVGNGLLRRYETAPFAVVAELTHKGTRYSLRSENWRVDVSKVAEAHGGGGHRNSAGFWVEAADAR